MADVRVKWYGDTVLPKITGMVDKRLLKAASYVRDHAKKQMRAQPTTGAGATKRGLDPSKEGEYPKKVREYLRSNIVSESDLSQHVARVGTNVKYGRLLELGTRKMGRRPWLSRALKECTHAIRRIITHG